MRAESSIRFLPYTQTTAIPHVIVDGARKDKTVLTLSHWPKSGSPAELKSDTSTAMVFNYLEAPPFHIKADVVSNNVARFPRRGKNPNASPAN